MWKYLPIFVFTLNLSLLNVKILRAYKQKTRSLLKKSSPLYSSAKIRKQSANFAGEESLNKNLWMGLIV